MAAITKINNKEYKIRFSKEEAQKIFQKAVRQLRDKAKMTEQELKMLSCIKKDNIKLSYLTDEDGSISISLTELENQK
jgi:20S proteasome alpha/beta subunit